MELWEGSRYLLLYLCDVDLILNDIKYDLYKISSLWIRFVLLVKKGIIKVGLARNWLMANQSGKIT